MGRRWAMKRDSNEAELFHILRDMHVDVRRLTDIDIVGRNVRDGVGRMLEVKVPGREKALRPIQKTLKLWFPEHYRIVTNVDEALEALGYK